MFYFKISFYIRKKGGPRSYCEREKLKFDSAESGSEVVPRQPIVTHNPAIHQCELVQKLKMGYRSAAY